MDRVIFSRQPSPESSAPFVGNMFAGLPMGAFGGYRAQRSLVHNGLIGRVTIFVLKEQNTLFNGVCYCPLVYGTAAEQKSIVQHH